MSSCFALLRIFFVIKYTLAFTTATGIKTWELSRSSIDSFIAKYDQPPHNNIRGGEESPFSAVKPFMRAFSNWYPQSSFASPENKSEPAEDKPNYSYFRWIPMYANQTLPATKDVVTFKPLQCFNKASAWSEYNSTNKYEVIIHLEVWGKQSLACDSMFAMGTIEKYVVSVIEKPGKHTIVFNIDPDSSADALWDLQAKGIRIFMFADDAQTTVEDALATVTLFECLETKKVFPHCAQMNVDFLTNYAGYTMEKRDGANVVYQNIDKSLIGSGDFFGVMRLDGLDPVLAWAMGSTLGHTTVAIWEEDDLYIMESTVNDSYWPFNGIQKTQIDEWMQHADNCDHNVVWLPLSPKSKSSFNVTTALQFFHQTQGTFYGFQNMLMSWIDTIQDNYPCLPPERELCLTWDLLETAMPFLARMFDGFDEMYLPAFNHRLGVDGFDIAQLYYQSYLDLKKKGKSEKESLDTSYIPTIPEQDSWRYAMMTNNGTINKNGISMVCTVFVCHMWKAGGLFTAFGLDDDEVNCGEFTCLDDYGIDMFDSNFDSWKPAACNKDSIDATNPLCMMMGDYEVYLPNYNTIVPHDHMAETCPSLAPDYSRPADC